MPIEAPEPAQQQRVHRALANVNRVRLMRLLEDGPQDVTTLAGTTGLHVNTVRAHLDVLVDGGLVTRAKRSAGRPGRPAWAYGLRAVPSAQPTLDRNLAGVLAQALASVSEDPAGAAEAAGRPWGRNAVAGEKPLTPREAVTRVVELLEEQGFAPQLEEDQGGAARVLLRACPYDDLAERYGEVVCSVHLGLIRGALEELGASVRADLRPKVAQNVCVTELGLPPDWR